MANDPRLEPLVGSGGAEGELERLLVGAAPLIRRIVSRYFRASEDAAHEAADLVATINLRLLHRLRRLTASPAMAIADFDAYVAMLSYNVINDYLRRRYPERARLKNRLRYALLHDRRLALWRTPAGMAAGLKEWTGGMAAAPAVTLEPEGVTRQMRDRDDPAGALHALFEATGRAVELEALVDYAAALWHIVDAVPVELEAAASATELVPEMLDRREMLRALWREIAELRPMQRKALLLNLRDEETVNVIALIVRTGTASVDDLAAALELSVEQLAEIWNDLPLDDLRIASLLGITRQQVINLRRAARDRLRRRLRNNQRIRTS